MVLDETPIGNFLELEGPQRWIDEVARQLGYSRREYIKDSYAALYREKCQTEHKTPGKYAFPGTRIVIGFCPGMGYNALSDSVGFEAERGGE